MVDVRVGPWPFMDGPRPSSLLEFKAFPSYLVFRFFWFLKDFGISLARMCVYGCVRGFAYKKFFLRLSTPLVSSSSSSVSSLGSNSTVAHLRYLVF
jgi:hypothetical protein